TSESCSSSAVRSSNDPASSIFADATTLATACRKASRNSGWSSAITRRVVAALVIGVSREARWALSPERHLGAIPELYHVRRQLTALFAPQQGVLTARVYQMRETANHPTHWVKGRKSYVSTFTPMLLSRRAHSLIRPSSAEGRT